MKTTIFQLLFFLAFSTMGHAVVVTKSHTYGTPLSVDGTATYGTSLVGLNFVSGVDLPATEQILSVTVTINFLKTDGSCGTPNTGNSYHNETNFRLDGPNGTNVILATTNTWSGATNVSAVTITFSQGAGSTPSGTPTSGTFLPNGGNLSDFAGEAPFGTWVLRAGDSAGADPLCINSFSITITTTSTLPIELHDFWAEMVESDHKSMIQWITKSETDNDFFTIERSRDAQNWHILDMVKGAGNSSEERSYEVFDNNILPNVSYYRLKQTDYNGRSKYFPAVSIYNPLKEIIAFSENNSIYVSLPNANVVRQISLYSLSGKLIHSSESINENSCFFPKVSSGMYLVAIQEKGVNITKKVVVR